MCVRVLACIQCITEGGREEGGGQREKQRERDGGGERREKGRGGHGWMDINPIKL